MSEPTLANFLSGVHDADQPGVTGNNPFSQTAAAELRNIAREAADRAPRSQQVHLGPSEIGVECDRQVAGKLAGVPSTNHVSDPWPSIMGTAFHAWIEAAVLDRARRTGEGWLAERRVDPTPSPPYPDSVDYSGTADLYRLEWEAVLDHKALGSSTHAKLKRSGPKRQYLVQLLVYARGYQLLGLPVRRIAIAAWPRTGSSLHDLYVWSRELDAETDALVDQVLGTDMPRREDYSALLRSGHITLNDVPATPDDDACYFCPFYRPEAARDGGSGCPGTTRK